MATVRDLLRGADTLSTDSARRDVEILLGHCLGKPRSWLYAWPESEVAAATAQHFEQLLARRRQGTPVAYLTGLREFWSLQLAVNEHTLIPRPATETLVEWALDLPLPADAAVLELGTGSGAIALAVASERPGWQLTAVDASEEALRIARANAARNGLHRIDFLHSDWYRAVARQRFHLLLANPPYVAAGDAHLTRGDVRFEPRAALVSADGGMADLARLIAGAPAQLVSSGWVLLEHGIEQGPQVRDLLRKAGLGQVSTRRDMAGHERISGACRHVE